MSIIVVQVVAIVGCYQRDSRFFRQPYQVRIDVLLDFQTLILDFHEEILLAKNIAQAVSILTRSIVFFFDHRFGYRSTQTRGKRDQSLAVLGEKVIIDARLVIKAFQKSARHQLDQVVVTLEIFAEQYQMVTATRAAFDFSPVTTV